MKPHLLDRTISGGSSHTCEQPDSSAHNSMSVSSTTFWYLFTCWNNGHQEGHCYACRAHELVC